MIINQLNVVGGVFFQGTTTYYNILQITSFFKKATYNQLNINQLNKCSM
jgi:hypothetical protein